MLLRTSPSPHGDRPHRHRRARDEHWGAMILRRLIERGHVGAKQLIEPGEVAVQLGAQLLHPPFDDFVRWLRVGQGEAEAESLRSEEHTSELQSQSNLVCRLLLEKNKTQRHGRIADA